MRRGQREGRWLWVAFQKEEVQEQCRFDESKGKNVLPVRDRWEACPLVIPKTQTLDQATQAPSRAPPSTPQAGPSEPKPHSVGQKDGWVRTDWAAFLV